MALCPVKVPPTSPIFRLHPPPNLHRFFNQELETLFGREVDFQNQRAVLPGFPELGEGSKLYLDTWVSGRGLTGPPWLSEWKAPCAYRLCSRIIGPHVSQIGYEKRILPSLENTKSTSPIPTNKNVKNGTPKTATCLFFLP